MKCPARKKPRSKAIFVEVPNARTSQISSGTSYFIVSGVKLRCAAAPFLGTATDAQGPGFYDIFSSLRSQPLIQTGGPRRDNEETVTTHRRAVAGLQPTSGRAVTDSRNERPDLRSNSRIPSQILR